MIRVAIIGAAGLSGVELLHWFERHPSVQVVTITSAKYQGQQLKEVFPQFHRSTLRFENHHTPLNCEVAFLAIPNQASLELVPQLLRQKIKVIDLSGVYRIPEVSLFEKYYQLSHSSPALIQQAVFGLPEIYRNKMKEAVLIANPGCYPTGALLGILPAQEFLEDLSSAPIIDAKSGVSGAGGRVEDDSTNYMTVNENFKAYKVFTHQHQPEIEYYLHQNTGYRFESGSLLFTPHLLPLSRGILSTIYLRFHSPISPAKMRERYEQFAQQQPFVTVLAQGQMPDLKMVQHTNQCYIGLETDEGHKNWIIITVIDNLVKGAAGQAIQNMNLMFGLEEQSGLV